VKIISTIGLCVAIGPGLVGNTRAHEEVTFSFSGFIEVQQAGPVPGLAVGDTFHGSFTFDPLTPRWPEEHPDNTLDSSYLALTSWNVTLPRSGLSFSGPSGVFAIGNDAPLWFLSDRYIATMSPSAEPIYVGGHQFTFFQIDLMDFGNNIGADLLRDSSLPAEPPDLALTQPHERSGRFVFHDASFQNRITSLTLIPEPSQYLLGLLAISAFVLRRAYKR
jgi:hypothetical protein